MALAATTLAGAKTLNQTVIVLTSATGAAKKMWALVDMEWMLITDVSLTPTLSVVPGGAGSAAMPHGALAPVIYGIPGDFQQVGLVPGTVTVGLSFGADGAITGRDGAGTVPQAENTIVYLTKATAGAYTLAGPTTRDQKNTITFISTTAAAHTVTYTAGFKGDTTGSDVATFAATINSSFTVQAQNGTWCPLATYGVTIA